MGEFLRLHYAKPVIKCYMPTAKALQTLCESIDWEHGEEDQFLNKIITEKMDKEDIEVNDENSAMNNPKPKQWRTYRVSYEDQKDMWNEEQGSLLWYTNRLFSTGSAGALAAYCGWMPKLMTSRLVFEVEAGLIVVKPKEDFNWFCMMRGNFGEPIVDLIANVVMGTESLAIGMVLHKDFHHKHSSPDRIIFYRHNVYHNMHTVKDMRRGLREIKYTVMGPTVCTHVEGNARYCHRQKKKIAHRHLPKPYYVIQMQDQLEVMKDYLLSCFREKKANELWNDFTTLWKTNSRCPPIVLTRIEQFIGDRRRFVPNKVELVGEFHCTRIYFNQKMINRVYDYFHEHVANVRAAEIELQKGVAKDDIKRPKKVHCPDLGVLKLVPLKHVQFVRFINNKNEKSKVECFVKNCWTSDPYEVTLDDLEHW